MYKKLLKNISFITIGTLASKLVVYFMIPLYTAVLTTEEYGSIDLIFTTSSLIMPVLSIEISNAVMRYLLDEKYNENKVIFNCLIILLVSVITFIITSLFLININIFKEFYFYFCIYYLSNLFNGFLQCIVRGKNYVKVYSFAGIIQTISTVFFNILFLLKFDFKIKGYLMAYSLGAIISFVYLFVIIINNRVIKFNHTSYDKKLMKEMMEYSIPLVPNSLLWWISNSSDKYMLTYFTELSTIGIYSVAYKIPTILSILSSIFISAWQISSVEDFGSEKNMKFFNNITNKYLYLTILLTSFILVILKPLCKLMFSNDFYNAWRVIPILLIGYVYYNMSIFLGTIYTASKKTKMVLISTVIGSVINILFNFILIPYLNMYGAALATTVSYILIYIIRKIDSKKIMILNLNNRDTIYGIILLIQSIMIYNNCFIVNLICFSVILLIPLKKHILKLGKRDL
ncbi:oligosaccharide flippase family protein [Longibaculum muris]|uniref:oligosaccharide flippase family protein n=1 Tax=Longibaculum muris TaxID=1796628 RepID=UPI0022E44D69|nr:oligosaccharide flippase family protein [Longibaculum muris]